MEVAAVFSIGGGGLRAPLSQFWHNQSQNSALWQGFLGVKFTYFIRSPINLVGSMNYFKNDQQMAKKSTNYEVRGWFRVGHVLQLQETKQAGIF